MECRTRRNTFIAADLQLALSFQMLLLKIQSANQSARLTSCRLLKAFPIACLIHPFAMELLRKRVLETFSVLRRREIADRRHQQDKVGYKKKYRQLFEAHEHGPPSQLQ